MPVEPKFHSFHLLLPGLGPGLYLLGQTQAVPLQSEQLVTAAILEAVRCCAIGYLLFGVPFPFNVIFSALGYSLLLSVGGMSLLLLTPHSLDDLK